VAFTRALGSLSIEHGVRVIGVNPGYVETERAIRGLRIRAQKELGDPEKWPELVRDLWPRGKMIAPKEIADVVVFLASDRASAMTGHIVTVDAGFASRSYVRRVNG
jgi:NAD(P)-dependent dehydrogenase (short-subunit alcohol dehydrogenase family)